MIVLRKFVDEILIAGNLYHLLECGHVQPASNRSGDGLPHEQQECKPCSRRLAPLSN